MIRTESARTHKCVLRRCRAAQCGRWTHSNAGRSVRRSSPSPDPTPQFLESNFYLQNPKKISIRKSDSINKWREIDTLLLHATNRKYHMAYPCRPKTLENLEGHLPNAGLYKCNSTNICATFSTVLTDMARRAVPRR